MSGVFAKYSGYEPVNASVLERGLTAMGNGVEGKAACWLSPCGHVGLGETGGMVSAEGEVLRFQQDTRAVASGRIVNNEVLRNHLARAGYSFLNDSDAELVCRLYDQKGTSMLADLRGEFSFLLWDAEARQLLAARDRYGSMPLYYASLDGCVYVASEIKALFAAGVPAIWDEESCGSRAHYYRDRTLFQNVHQIPPGHFLLAGENGLRVCSYWDLSFPPEQEPPSIDEEEAVVQAIRASLLEAVSLRMNQGEATAVCLSGGLDSAAILGMVSHLSSKRPHGFTLSFEDKTINEGSTGRKNAKFARARYNPVKVTGANLAAAFSQTIFHGESLLTDAHGLAMSLLGAAGRKAGFQSMLSGLGGDVVFGGSSHFLKDQMRYGRNMGAALHSLDLNWTDPTSDAESFMSHCLGFEPGWLQAEAARLNVMLPFFTHSQRGAPHRSMVRQMMNHLDTGRLQAMAPMHASMYLYAKSVLANGQLVGTRALAAHSVTPLFPLMDHHFSQLFNAPVSANIKAGRDKYLFRKAVAPFVPEALLMQKKRSFQTPEVDASAGALFLLARDLLTKSLLRDIPFLNQSRVLTFLEELPKNSTATPFLNSVLMELLSLGFIQRHFKPGSPPLANVAGSNKTECVMN